MPRPTCAVSSNAASTSRPCCGRSMQVARINPWNTCHARHWSAGSRDTQSNVWKCDWPTWPVWMAQQCSTTSRAASRRISRHAQPAMCAPYGLLLVNGNVDRVGRIALRVATRVAAGADPSVFRTSTIDPTNQYSCKEMACAVRTNFRSTNSTCRGAGGLCFIVMHRQDFCGARSRKHGIKTVSH